MMHLSYGAFGQTIGSQNTFKNSKEEQRTAGGNLNNNSSAMYLSSTNRTGKFLFDMFFGIDSEISNAFGNLDVEDLDYEENVSLKTCDCGKFSGENER